MSRSYKQPYITQRRRNRWKDKRFAQKVVRNTDIDGGNHYRKFYQSYDICDYAWYSPEYPESRRK